MLPHPKFLRIYEIDPFLYVIPQHILLGIPLVSALSKSQ